MKKKYLIILLAVLTVLGALFTALSSNMLFDDIFNIQLSFSENTLYVSLPAISVSLYFVLAIFYLLRTYKHPDCRKRITRLYLILTIIFGAIGVIGGILGGALVYRNFFGKNPFPGYLPLFICFNITIIALASIALGFLKRMKDDEGRVKVTPKYVFKTIGWFLFTCLLLNRFGMFLGSPVYIYWRNFYQTFPVYLYQLLPLFLGVLEALYILDILKGKKMLILALVGIGLDVIFFAYTALIGINDTAFISSLSQLFPLERMAAKPVELPIHFLAYIGVGIGLIVQYKGKKEVAE